jgi:hypothetical protein
VGISRAGGLNIPCLQGGLSTFSHHPTRYVHSHSHWATTALSAADAAPPLNNACSPAALQDSCCCGELSHQQARCRGVDMCLPAAVGHGYQSPYLCVMRWCSDDGYRGPTRDETSRSPFTALAASARRQLDSVCNYAKS